ncbi:hypothetical protein FRC08_011049 [Ceratobasidium sp. 394]|nr:hypothetical protein FRC08_011049 [Ceratobasidium sp. 394]
MVARHCSSSTRTLIHDVLQTRKTSQSTRGTITNLRAFSIAALNQPQPSSRHPAQTRSRYGISRPPGWEPRSLVAPCSDEEAVEYFARLLPPLRFPQETAVRIITHSSWRAGMEGTNRRFSFIGRRVLEAYMLAFLHAHTPLTPTPPLTRPPSDPQPDTQISRLPMPSSILEQDFTEITNQAVNAPVLGMLVGNVWELERVMRWVPNLVGESISNDPGLYTVRGTTVEAVVGGVFHQFVSWVKARLLHRLTLE